MKGKMITPKRPENIPLQSQWLGGIGAGSWFYLEKLQHTYWMSRFSEEGILECKGEFVLTDEGFDILLDYQFTYLSHCEEFILIQHGKKYKFQKNTMKIKMYGADWCSDCINAKNILTSKGIDFEYVVITDNPDAIAFVEQINEGKRIIPTLVIDGVVYTNPGVRGLLQILENKE